MRLASLQIKSILTDESRFLLTGQSFATRFNKAFCSMLSSTGRLILTWRLSMRRGPSVVIVFSTLALTSPRAQPRRRAVIPMTVKTHVPSAVATRSVGEKLSPKPSWSVGASVSNTPPEGPCRAVQCKSPLYSQWIAVISHWSFISSSLHLFWDKLRWDFAQNTSI